MCFNALEGYITHRERLAGLEELLASQVPRSASGSDESSRSTGVGDLRRVQDPGGNLGHLVTNLDTPGLDRGASLPGELLAPRHDGVTPVGGRLGRDLDHLSGLVGRQLEGRQAVEGLDDNEFHGDVGPLACSDTRETGELQVDVVLLLEVRRDGLLGTIVLGESEFLSRLQTKTAEGHDLVGCPVSDLELGSEEDFTESLNVVLRQALKGISLSGRSAKATSTGTTAASVGTATASTRTTTTTTETTVVATEEAFGDFDQRSRGDKGRVGSVELNGRNADRRSERPRQAANQMSGKSIMYKRSDRAYWAKPLATTAPFEMGTWSSMLKNRRS